MPEIPDSQSRQVARGVAIQGSLRPRWREAAIAGAIFGAAAGILLVLDPVLPLGPSEPRRAVGGAMLVRAVITGAVTGVVICSVAAFLVRLARRAIAAARFGSPVA